MDKAVSESGVSRHLLTLGIYDKTRVSGSVYVALFI